jgi:hypothetical protein
VFRFARGASLASALLPVLLTGVARAVPPSAGLQRNSLSVTSTAGRYRPQRPTVSPYLALVPGGLGNLAAINYFNIVKPELSQLQVNDQQGMEIRNLKNELQGAVGEIEAVEEAAVKKQAAGFMTHHKYFGLPTNQSALQNPAKNLKK